MPLIETQDTDIIIELSDLEIGDSVVKRKAVVNWLRYSPRYKVVVVDLEILTYARNEDDSYGELIGNTRSFRNYEFPLTANRDEFVNPETGEIIGTRIEYENPDNSLPAQEEVLDEEDNVITPARPAGKFYGIDFITEFEYLDTIAKNYPIVLADVIIQYVQNADSKGNI